MIEADTDARRPSTSASRAAVVVRTKNARVTRYDRPMSVSEFNGVERAWRIA
jgi:hypothetical protein